MSEFRLEIDPAMLLRVTGTAGDLEVEGHEENVVEVEAGENFERYVQRDENTVTITGYPDDLSIRVPRTASVELYGIGGDVEVRQVAQLGARESAKLMASGIGGDASIADVPVVELGAIGGDAEIRGECQSLTIANVGGDLQVERADLLSVRAVGGDAELESIGRLTGLGHIGGDLELHWAGEADGDLRAIVGGDADITLKSEPNLKLSAMVGGDFEGHGENWNVSSGSGSKQLVFGEGQTQLSLTVGGDLSLKSPGAPREQSGWGGEWARSPGMDAFGEEMRGLGKEMEEMGRTLARDLSNLGREIAREVRVAGRETMRGMKDDFGPRGARGRGRININGREINFDPEQVERIKREARAAAASGIAQAQEAVERALGEWTRGVVDPRGPRAPRPPQPPRTPEPPTAPAPPVGSVYTGQTIRMDAPKPGEPPVPPAPPASLDSQRLAILRMVHEGRLSPDEAELLLRGLEERR